jgi:hypothetical protein
MESGACAISCYGEKRFDQQGWQMKDFIIALILGLIFNHLFFSFSSLSVSNYLFVCSSLPARALPYALSYFCLGSSWAPFHWRLLLGRVGAAFIEHRLSFSILYIIFYADTVLFKKVSWIETNAAYKAHEKNAVKKQEPRDFEKQYFRLWFCC